MKKMAEDPYILVFRNVFINETGTRHSFCLLTAYFDVNVIFWD